ncbi:hypothetical protein ACR8J5_22295, partial [Salmonella enterica subsp. enterica serovar Paratyphi A]
RLPKVLPMVLKLRRRESTRGKINSPMKNWNVIAKITNVSIVESKGIPIGIALRRTTKKDPLELQ